MFQKCCLRNKPFLRVLLYESVCYVSHCFSTLVPVFQYVIVDTIHFMCHSLNVYVFLYVYHSVCFNIFCGSLCCWVWFPDLLKDIMILFTMYKMKKISINFPICYSVKTNLYTWWKWAMEYFKEETRIKYWCVTNTMM